MVTNEPWQMDWEEEITEFDEDYALLRGTDPETGEEVTLKFLKVAMEDAEGETVWERTGV